MKTSMAMSATTGSVMSRVVRSLDVSTMPKIDNHATGARKKSPLGAKRSSHGCACAGWKK